jgi:hypothetical protein
VQTSQKQRLIFYTYTKCTKGLIFTKSSYFLAFFASNCLFYSTERLAPTHTAHARFLAISASVGNRARLVGSRSNPSQKEGGSGTPTSADEPWRPLPPQKEPWRFLSFFL